MIAKFQPDMNSHIALPKDFKDSTPKAKKSDYPALTGYTALHLGKFINKQIVTEAIN